MAGPCSNCGATMQMCDEHIREHGTGCCDQCFIRDTHGLVHDLPAPTGPEAAQELANLTRLAAQTVIARSEHAKAIRELRADVGRLLEEVASLRAVPTTERQAVLEDLMGEVRKVVEDLPERVKETEDCIEAIEQRLRIRRRPKDQR